MLEVDFEFEVTEEKKTLRNCAGWTEIMHIRQVFRLRKKHFDTEYFK